MGKVGRITRSWTKEEDQYVISNYGDKTCSEIANDLDRTLYSIRKRLPVLGLSKSAKKYEYNENYFEEIDTEDKAYWLGFLSADGCIVDTSKGSKRVQLILKESDKSHLEKFVKCIDGNIPVRLRKQNVNGKEYGSSKLVVHSTKMSNDLIKHGVHPRKTYDIQFPNINNSLVQHYLRGLIDGDGTLYVNKNKSPNRKTYKMSIEIASTSKKHLESIQEWFQEIGVDSGIYPTHNHFKLSMGSMNSIKVTIDNLYKNSNIYLDRKYEKAKEMISLMPSP